MVMNCIHFQGNCEEAINFYKDALRAEVKEVIYAKDAPPNSGTEALPPHFVMHSDIIINGANFSLTDGSTTPITGENISYLIIYETEAAVARAYEKLIEGGKIVEPLGVVFWSPLYGYVIDRFGVNWQVMVAQSG